MNLKSNTLEDLLELLKVGLFRTARQDPGIVLSANDAMARMLGFQRAADLIGQPVRRFYQNLDERSRYVDVLDKFGSVENWPMHLNRADGSRLEGICCSHAVYNELGEFVTIEGILLDQTAANRQRQMRDSMIHLSQKFSRKLSPREVGRLIANETRRLFEHDALTLAIYDQATRSTLTFVYSEDTPLGADEPQEYDAGTLVWPSLNPKPQLINRDPREVQAINRFVPFGAEERRSMSLMFAPMRYQDQFTGVLSVQSYTPFKYSQENLDELVWLGNECAGAIERVIAEDALTQREMECRLLLNTSPHMTVLLSRDGDILDINEQMCARLGQTKSALSGKRFFDFIPLDLAQGCRQVVERVMQSREKVQHEKSHEGRTFHVECHPMKPLNGDELRVALFIQDITDIRRNERLAALGLTASSLAHYIKNVQMSLNSSIKYLDEQLMQLPNERVHRMWPVAKRAAARVDQLVMDILNLSRDREPDLRATSINTFLFGLVEEYQPNAKAHGIELNFEPSECDMTIHIDHVQIWDVMLNLIANAIEAINEIKKPDGKIIVCAGRDDDNPGQAWIVVSDNGPGLKPGIKARVFDAFFTTKGGQGTGLGLAVARKIIEGHNGQILVDSIPNVGMTCKIVLPLDAPAADLLLNG